MPAEEPKTPVLEEQAPALAEQTPAEAVDAPEAPNAAYDIPDSVERTKRLYKTVARRQHILYAVLIAFLLISTVLLYFTSDYLCMLPFGMAMILLMLWLMLAVNMWERRRKASANAGEKSTHLEIYTDRAVWTELTGGAEKTRYTIRKGEVTQTQRAGDDTVFYRDGIAFILPSKVIAENPVLGELLASSKRQRPKGTLLLALMTFVCIVLICFVIPEFMPYSLLSAALEVMLLGGPIALMVVCIVRQAKGCGKASMTVMSILIAVVLSFHVVSDVRDAIDCQAYDFLYPETAEMSADPEIAIGYLGELGVELPPAAEVNWYVYEDFKNGYAYMPKDSEEPILDVQADPHWTDALPTALRGLDYRLTYGEPICCVYNRTTGEYNTVPSAAGTYEWVIGFYTPEDNRISLTVKTSDWIE